MQILVVDDQKRTRQSLSLLLNTLQGNLQIREAENGEEAIQLITDSQPDLIVMDGKMPKMDGVQATRQIKNRWPQIKIILLSMYPEYQELGCQAGADAFISKGEPPDFLLNKVCEMMDSGGSGDSGQSIG